MITIVELKMDNTRKASIARNIEIYLFVPLIKIT